MIRAGALLLLLALSACSGAEDSAGGLSKSEQRQLDEAAAAVDINNVEPANSQ